MARLANAAGYVVAVALCCAGTQASAAGPRLVDAVRSGDVAAVRSLLDAHVDVNVAEPDGTTALHWAVETDRVELVRLLAGAGANISAINRYGATPLWLACLNGSAASIEILLG